METDYQKMYNNLTVLLQDICQFLSSDKLGSLGHRDRKLVECLINRSKVQLQEIAKIEKVSATEEYVDMDANKVSVPEVEEEKFEVYSSVDDVNKNVGTIEHEELLCPYLNLHAKDVNQNVKCGFMSMKRKFLLGFEKMRRVYGAIHNHWLLIYFTEKCVKPFCTFNLKHFEAREADDSKSTTFELMSTSSDQKVYYFMALTPKDMLQWVVNINRCHDSVIIHSKTLDLAENIEALFEEEEHYDSIVPGLENQTDDSNEEDIYAEPDNLLSFSRINNNSQKSGKNIIDDPGVGPPLPGRRPIKAVSVPIPPPIITPVDNTDELLGSYDDIQQLTEAYEPSLDDALSEDDGDTTYESFVHVKQTINKKSNPLLTEAKNEVNGSTNEAEISVILKTNKEATTLKNESVSSIKDKFESNVKKDEINDSTKSALKSETAVGVLSPPVIPKVPVVPLKPKIKGRPSIGKRPAFANFRQITNDR